MSWAYDTRRIKLNRFGVGVTPIDVVSDCRGKEWHDNGRTPSTYGRTWSQKKPQSSTTRPTSLSSSTSASFPLRVSIPEPISSDVSLSRVATALAGELDTTLCIWRLTSWFKSSLGCDSYVNTRCETESEDARTWVFAGVHH